LQLSVILASGDMLLRQLAAVMMNYLSAQFSQRSDRRCKVYDRSAEWLRKLLDAANTTRMNCIRG